MFETKILQVQLEPNDYFRGEWERSDLRDHRTVRYVRPNIRNEGKDSFKLYGCLLKEITEKIPTVRHWKRSDPRGLREPKDPRLRTRLGVVRDTPRVIVTNESRIVSRTVCHSRVIHKQLDYLYKIM